MVHAFRDAGGQQDTFIGGALAVGRKSFTSFFPNIYNEDWFFLLDDTGLRPSAVTARRSRRRSTRTETMPGPGPRSSATRSPRGCSACSTTAGG
ncbi:hypothetical protein [Kibdelosporangium phytohabitans]|uniref:hypothetical protein n=1 Tax=Kibdelosporangium phytohabitans TaxID=860235 RepID=UPI000AE97A7F|nr:hypothetical protein [Kibdelosporangium phytohabitans]MBE1469836.1 hypothetical protein [Kibdelosporangium phytohabitans]